MYQKTRRELRYHKVMNYIGILYTILIFAGCFFVVHIAVLAVAGFKSLKRRDGQPPPEEKPKKTEPQKIYYIVEKKRAKKSSYSEPKEIDFK